MKKWISSGYALTLFAALAIASDALAEHYTVPLLVPATTSDAPQGVLRILNGTQESGAVEIYAIDDGGNRSGPATVTLNASAAVELTATDLVSDNATKGLAGGIGADVSDVRLVIETDIDLVLLAYVRAADGTLSAMHDTARGFYVDEFGYDTGHQYHYDVPLFNSASDVTQASRLRLINPGDISASVTISARDDSGAVATGGDLTLAIAAGGAQTLTAQQLEAGDSTITGQLGAGVGKWRLTVSSDQPLQVVNLVAASSGYLNNLSTTALRGAAPTNQAALNERFVGVNVIYETGNGRFTLNAMADERFTETGESDGVSTTFVGSYTYVGIGPDAGRLTLMYDDGDECRANFYFSSRTTGWFASHCTSSDDPDGHWLGGNWFVEDPGDTLPSFTAMSAPGDQTYTVGTAIEILTLPQASGGDGALTYSLSPDVPGLSFDATHRQFTGTPSAVGTYAMTYAVMDKDGDTATLDFNIMVSADLPETGSGVDCHVGLLASIGESCTYPGTTDVFTVNVRGRGRFLTFLAGIRIRVNDQTINGRVYDFVASHQGEGVWRIDRIAGSTEPPSTNGEDGEETGTDTENGGMGSEGNGDDNGVDAVGNTFEVGDILAGVPTSGLFVPAALVGGFIETTDSGTTINSDDGGYVELSNGTRYTCTSVDGCSVENGTVTRGTLVEIAAGSAPNLIVEAASVSDTDPALGQSLTLSVSVRNAGSGESAAATLRYYRSTDATISTLDTEVGTDAVGVLSASGTSAESVSLTAPSTSGTYYYGACVDSVTGESDATDNCSGSVAVRVEEPTEHPDLEVGTPSVSDTSPSPDDAFTLSVRVRNSGDGESTVTTLRYYRSRNATISTSDTAVGTDLVGALAASETSTESVSLTAPSGAGTYYYGACVDSVTGESDATDNCSGSVAVRVEELMRHPDLEVGTPSVSDTSPSPDDAFMLSVTVRNAGDGESAATTLRYYRSTDATISTSDTAEGTDSVGALATSGASAESISLTVPSTAGTYYYGACVDAVAGESHTTDNCSASVKVDVVGTPTDPVGGICDRTALVRDAIVDLIPGVHTCSAVTDADLAAITATLNLNRTGISSLRSGDFSGLGSLRSLLLAGNQLTALPADIFSGLVGVRMLRLHGNELDSLPANVFDGLASVDILDLEYNNLTTLPSGLFAELNLRFLGLEGNQLRTLSAGMFDSLGGRLTLDLSHNQLAALQDSVFASLDVEWLDLANNSLQTLPAGVFSGLTSLDSLFLENNPGADFSFTMTIQRVPNTHKVVVVVPEGAPFDMTTTISATGGPLPDAVSEVTVPVGRTRSAEIAVTPLDGTTISLGAAPAVPSSFRFKGFVTAVGDPITF